MSDILNLQLTRRWVLLAVAGVLVVASVGVFAASGQRSGPGKLVPAAEAATVDYFLKLDGIEGESTDDKHKGQIELESWSWGESQPGLIQTSSSTGGGGGAGKVTVHDIHFTMHTSKASPELMTATASGKHFKEAVLVVRKGGQKQQDYFKITLSDVLVSSYGVGAGGDENSVPVDQVSLNFGKVKMQHYPQGADGSLSTPVEGIFDVKGNKVE